MTRSDFEYWLTDHARYPRERTIALLQRGEALGLSIDVLATFGVRLDDGLDAYASGMSLAEIQRLHIAGLSAASHAFLRQRAVGE